MVPVLASLTHQPTDDRKYILRTFDLSNNRSLRSLEIGIPRGYGSGMSFLGDLLATVTSSVFSDVVIILPDAIIHDLNLQNTLFRAVQDMYKVRPFRLVFWLGKLPVDGEDNRERLKELIASEGGLGSLLHPPVIVSYTRAALPVGSIDTEYLLEHGAL